MSTPEERIAEVFNGCFTNFAITIAPEDVTSGWRAVIRQRGWHITLRVTPDDAGSPSLEFYATHRMTSDRHIRIWADGFLEHLDAIQEFVVFDPKIPGSKEASEERYFQRNRAVAEQLRASGLYPEGDINAFLRTGGDRDESPTDPADDRGGGTSDERKR